MSAKRKYPVLKKKDMKEYYILGCPGGGIGGFLITIGTFSRITHTANCFGNDYVMEAVNKKVRKNKLEDCINRYKYVYVLKPKQELTDEQIKAGQDYLASREGKDYDTKYLIATGAKKGLGILRFLPFKFLALGANILHKVFKPKKYDVEDADYCSELTHNKLRAEEVHEGDERLMTPGDIMRDKKLEIVGIAWRSTFA